MAFYRCSSGESESNNININGTIECECYVQDDFSQGDIIYGENYYNSLTVPIKDGLSNDSKYFYINKKIITLNNGKKYLFVFFLRDYTTDRQCGYLSYCICELDENCAVIQYTVTYQYNCSYDYISYFDNIILNTEEDIIIGLSYKPQYNSDFKRGYLAFSFDLSVEELTTADITCNVICNMYDNNTALSQVPDLRYNKPKQTEYLIKVGENAYVGAYTYYSSNYYDYIVLFYKTQQNWAYKQYQFSQGNSSWLTSSSYGMGLHGTADGNKFYISCKNIFGVYNEEAHEITWASGTCNYNFDLPSGESLSTRSLMHLKDNYYLLYTTSYNSTNRRGFCKVYYIDFDNKIIDSDFNSIEVTTERYNYNEEPIPGIHGSEIFSIGNRLFLFYKMGRIAELTVDYENRIISKVNDFSLYQDPSTENLVINKQGWIVYKNMFITIGDSSRVYIYQIKNDSIKIQSIVTLSTAMYSGFSYNYTSTYFMEIHNNKLYMLYDSRNSSSGSSKYQFVIADIFSGNILKESNNFESGDKILSRFYDKEKNNFVMFDSKVSTYEFIPPYSSTPYGYYKMISVISYIYANKLSREGDIFGIAIDDISKYCSGTVLKLPTKYNSLETEIAALSDDIEMLSVATDNMEDALDALLTSI